METGEVGRSRGRDDRASRLGAGLCFSLGFISATALQAQDLVHYQDVGEESYWGEQEVVLANMKFNKSEFAFPWVHSIGMKSGCCGAKGL